MVDSECKIESLPVLEKEEVKISAKSFVTQNAGKLRDFYRIGKMLGSGKRQLQLICG